MHDDIRTRQDIEQTMGAYRNARILQTAVKLRLFDYLREETSIQEVAAAANVSERGADILLHALVSMGLLIQFQEKFRNAEVSELYLTTEMGGEMVLAIDHAEQTYRRWAYLPESVLDGEPPMTDLPSVNTDPEANRVFVNAMHSFAGDRARAVADALDLLDVHRVLDVGGGPGTYLMALADRIPEFEGVLVDQPLTLKIAEDHFRKAGLETRIRTRAADIFDKNCEFEPGFDLALLSNIIHIVDPATNIDLLRRIRKSLRGGGKLLLQDYLMDDTYTRPSHAAFFAVNMLAGTRGGRAWRESDVREWLYEAGYQVVDRLNVHITSDILIAV